MGSGQTIRAQLFAYVAVFALLVTGLAATAILAVSQVDNSAETINQKWLAGTRALSELERQVFAFRLAESDRALAASAQTDAPAESTAAAYRAAVDGAMRSYLDIIGPEQPQVNMTAFAAAWADYLVIHDAWVRADVYRHAGGVARSKSSLDWRYRGVIKALDELKAANYQAADGQAQGSRTLARASKYIVVGAAVLAVLLSLALFLQIRRTITQPLASITAALSRLAAGSLEVSIPELHRDDEIGAMAKAFEVFRTNAVDLEDAHAQTRVAQRQADLLARHDALTGLPNRRVFSGELDAAIVRAQAGVSAYAVMLVDLDRFKPVNDMQGHAVGDQVLCEVAQRLESVPTKRKTVARLGGDEFSLIIETDPDTAAVKRDAIAAAQQVLQALREPIFVGDLRIEIGASIGIACCPHDGTGAEDLLRASDLAMYRAKQDGRNTFRFFEQTMDRELREQALLDDCFRAAVARGEIRPFYQPLVGLDQDEVRGFEVLSRWTHPEHGPIAPDRFIAMAERMSPIPDLTASILRQACRDARLWGEGIRLAINVSPSQLTDRLFPTKILAILSEERFSPSRLEIEITESALVGDIEVAKEILTTLQSLGVTVALDDFGTGYSSLYHLRNLKFDKLKIDRSFVQSLGTNTESVKIVDAVLSLARSLGMPVVAEGIEDNAALRHLVQRGCEYGQGFFFSKAVSAEHAADFIASRSYRLSA